MSEPVATTVVSGSSVAAGGAAAGRIDMVPGLAARVRQGERKAIARAITHVEDGTPEGEALLDALFPETGRAHRVGLTGPPGAGKSTLTNALAERLREAGRTVGIVCVDPTSPFTGGALLGDRIRMTKVALDPAVFIRSMASRGALGGIARATGEALDVLDAAGKDALLVETVGVGQSEVEIAEQADTIVVVLSPEAGDAVQTMKAGLMEIADVFVVNKCDREGADRMVRAIDAMLELGPAKRKAAIAGTSGERAPARPAPGEGHGPSHAVGGAPAGFTPAGREGASPPVETSDAMLELGPAKRKAAIAGAPPPASDADPHAHLAHLWMPPVVKTAGTTGEGVGDLLAAIDRHRAWLAERGLLAQRRQDRVEASIRQLISARLWRLLWGSADPDAELSRAAARTIEERISPRRAAERLLERLRLRA